MPSGPAHLHARWQHDGNALKQLEGNFTVDGGWIKPIRGSYKPTMRDLSAIAYLVMEWDYAYSDTDLQIDLSKFEDFMDISYSGKMHQLEVGPNDVLVLKMEFVPTKEVIEAIRNDMKKHFPFLENKFIVIGKDMDIFVIKNTVE